MAIIANYNVNGLKLKKVYIDLLIMSGSVSSGWTGVFGVWVSQSAQQAGDTQPFTTMSVYAPSSLNSPQFDLQKLIAQNPGLSSVVEV